MFSEAWLEAVLFNNHVATQVKHSEFKGKAVSIKYHFDWGFLWHKLRSRASIRWPIYLSSKHVISSLAFCLILTLSTLQFIFHWYAGSVSDSLQGEPLLSGGDVRCPLPARLQFCPYPIQGVRDGMLQSSECLMLVWKEHGWCFYAHSFLLSHCNWR